jgi:hypothetical protein
LKLTKTKNKRMIKKFTYEITVEATEEAEAEAKMEGLRLLTSCEVVLTHPDYLTKEEQELLSSFRQGGRTAKLIHLCLGEMLPNVFQKSKSETNHKTSNH